MAHMTLESLGRPIELLLVEDNHGDVLLTREACEESRSRINLAVAVDGEEALSMLRRQGRHADHPRPDLILLDMNLPCMDGREVLEAIKGDLGLRRIPTIVLTSSAVEIAVLKRLGLKADNYIVKPIEFNRLQQIMASLEPFWFTAAALSSCGSIGAAGGS